MDIYKINSVTELIKGNPYVGRGIVAGCSPEGKAVSAYFIMGRSANSRNRIFALKEGELFTGAPSLRLPRWDLPQPDNLRRGAQL